MVASSHQDRSPAEVSPERLAHSRKHEEIEDAEFEPIHDKSSKKRAPSSKSPSTLVASILYGLMMRGQGSMIEITGEKDDESAKPWGFWVGSVTLIALIGFVLMRGAAGGIFALMDVLIITALASLAIVAIRFGPKGERRRVALTRLDLERRLLIWPPRQLNAAEIILPFAQITEVVFGMVHFPVSPSRPDTRLHVYTVLVRDEHTEQLLPLIEATLEKRSSFLIAEQIAGLLQVPLTQIGEGVWGRHPHP